MRPPNQLLIEGSVSKRFEPVRQAFIENFTRRGELGGACCIYQDGEKVVDLWGGVRDRASGAPWRAARRGEDTMVVVHSTTKGLAAMAMALAHSRRWLDRSTTNAGTAVRARRESDSSSPYVVPDPPPSSAMIAVRTSRSSRSSVASATRNPTVASMAVPRSPSGGR